MSFSRPPEPPPNWGGPPNGPPPQGNGSGQRAFQDNPQSNVQQWGNGQVFQYSNNSGRRKALVIGCNYIGSKNQLNGCINDAHAMSSYLQRNHGYRSEDMVILTDDQQNSRAIPTKQNIIQAMQWLVSDARPNDSLFFHYSGHGGTTPDLNGDEADGFDDVIYPVDFEVAGHIVDDDMHAIMVRPLPQGCRLTALFDSCHSGTALDLPFVYSTKGVVKEPNVYKDAGIGALTAFMDYERGDLMGAFTSVKNVFNKVTHSNASTAQARQANFSPADVISFSGCKDDQTSADASQGGVSAGAMSYAFLEVMGQNPNQSYISLLNNVRNVMQGRFSQKPQLSSSHPIDMNRPFTI